jgi:hypothetical protein
MLDSTGPDGIKLEGYFSILAGMHPREELVPEHTDSVHKK